MTDTPRLTNEQLAELRSSLTSLRHVYPHWMNVYGQAIVAVDECLAHRAREEKLRALLDDGCGLSIDMLDADRLAEWARLIEVHGADITEWTTRNFLVTKLRDISRRLVENVRDVGKFRAILDPPAKETT